MDFDLTVGTMVVVSRRAGEQKGTQYVQKSVGRRVELCATLSLTLVAELIQKSLWLMLDHPPLQCFLTAMRNPIYTCPGLTLRQCFTCVGQPGLPFPSSSSSFSLAGTVCSSLSSSQRERPSCSGTGETELWGGC